MKRIALIAAMLLGLGASAQEYYSKQHMDSALAKHAPTWHFYFSPGFCVSQGQVGYNLETGFYDKDFWVAMTNETYATEPKLVMMTGIRVYYELGVINAWQLYVNGAAKFVENGTDLMVYEPGIAVVWQPGKLLAYQAGFSFPTTKYGTTIAANFAINFDF